MRALRVVPGVVQLRVALILVAALLALGSILWGVQRWPALQLGVAAVIVGAGGYVGWCRWPRWRWGIAAAQLAELPQPPQQPLRLTFDDGPTPGVTEVVLALLAQAGVQASFFVLVAKARCHPALIRRIVAEGHLLGLHGEDHRLPFRRSARELTQVLAAARAELEQLAGQPITLYRPSHGYKNLALVRAIRRTGLRFCFWDYGVWDTDAPLPTVLLRRLRTVTPAAGAASPGPTVLLHDGLGDTTTPPPHATPLTTALQQWLPELRAAPQVLSAR